MKRILLLFTIGLMPLSVFSQRDPGMRVGFFWGPDRDVIIQSFDVSQFNVLDTAIMLITYKYQYKKDARVDNYSVDTMLLQVGLRNLRFHSSYSQLYDSIYTQSKLDNPNKPARGAWLRLDFDIYTDVASGVLDEVHRMPYRINQAITYQEKRPKLKWHITDQTSSLLGYKCLKAEAELGGRKWIAWFTTEIPIQAGPWKLYGLPGLILKAHDSDNNFIFDCIGLNNQPSEIRWYNWKYNRMKKSAWLKYDKDLHIAPYSYVDDGENRFLVHENNQLVELTNSNWTLPHNPLELK